MYFASFIFGVIFIRKRDNFPFRVILSTVILALIGVAYYLLKNHITTAFDQAVSSSTVHMVWYQISGVFIMLAMCISFRNTLYECVICFVFGSLLRGIAAGIFEFLTVTLGSAITGGDSNTVLLIAVFLTVYLAFYVLLRLLKKKRRFDVKMISNTTLFVQAIIVYAISMFFTLGITDLFVKNTTQEGVYLLLPLVKSACSGILLFFLLNVINLEMIKFEKAIQGAIMAEKESQYSLTQDTIDTINRKCHDLKKQVSVLKGMSAEEREKQLEEIDQAIDIYETIAKTNNDTVNLLLMEKNLILKEKNIVFTYMINGDILECIEPIDLYTLLCNALDNAIEACVKIPKDKRMISLIIKESVGLIHITVENSYDGVVIVKEEKLMTTKANRNSEHGYGLESIKYVANKYGGDCKVRYDENSFKLSVVLAVPERYLKLQGV